MDSKWRIKGIESHVIGEDKNLYRLPYTKGKRSFSIRLIKLQKAERWVINGEAWSKRQLKHLIYKDPHPIELTKEDNLPF